jgi:hypothetical protein
VPIVNPPTASAKIASAGREWDTAGRPSSGVVAVGVT